MKPPKALAAGGLLCWCTPAGPTRPDALPTCWSTNGNGRYLPVAGDLGSLAGVRELVDAVHVAAPKGLNGLVNNAGAAFASKALSPDGYERTIAINHVALGGTDRRAARPAPEGRC